MPRQSSGAYTTLDMLDGIMAWALKVAAVAIILITGYYVYATVAANSQIFRGLANTGTQMSVQEFQRHVGNMQLLTKLLLLASVVLTVAVLSRYFMFPESGAALLVVGALLFFGMPFFIDNQGGPEAGLPQALARLGNPRIYLKSQFMLAGMIPLAAGVAQLIFQAVYLMANSRRRRPKVNAEAAKTAATVKKKANDRFLGPCWSLPFCRDTDKELCPIRQAKKSCWRTGRGCYCDQNVILTLSGGNVYAASRGSGGYLARTANISKPKSLREKRDQCLGCPVYLHHQSQKYKVMAPGSVIVSIGLFIYYWDTVKNLYPDTMKAVGRALNGLSFGQSTNGIPQWALDLANNPGLMWMIIGVGGILLIAYMLHGVEWVLYRLGI